MLITIIIITTNIIKCSYTVTKQHKHIQELV